MRLFSKFETGKKNFLQGGTAKCVYGITSYGGSIPDKCNPEYGSIYTRVSAYIDWIKEKTTKASF